MPKQPTNLSTCRALILIDGKPIRRKALAAYRRARTSFLKVSRELERYTYHDEIEYKRDFDRVVAPLMNEANELSERFDALDEVIFIIRDHAAYDRCAEHVVLTRIEKKQEQLADEYRKQFERWMNEDDEPHSRESKSEQDFRDEWDYIWSDDLDDFDDDWDDSYEFSQDYFSDMFNARRRRALETGAKNKKDENLKRLYRELALSIHPDMNGNEATAHKWHAVQEAYRKGDLEQLEILRLQSNNGNEIEEATATVGKLQEIRQLLKNATRKVRSQLRNAKNSDSWEYSSLDTEERKETIYFVRDLYKIRCDSLKANIAKCEAYLQKLRDEAARSAAGKEKKRKAKQAAARSRKQADKNAAGK